MIIYIQLSIQFIYQQQNQQHNHYLHMINNSPITQIHVIQQHQFKHRRRLQRILQSKPSYGNASNNAHQYNFSSSFLHMLETRRFNHEKWKEFNRNRQRETLMQRNQKMFNKLINITVEQGPYAQKSKNKQTSNNQSQKSDYIRNSKKMSLSQQNIEQVDRSDGLIEQDSYTSSNNNDSKRFRSTSLHHNYHVQNMKKSKIIDEQNPKLAQRLMEKTGYYDHIRDLHEFRKTREIMHRLQKFQQIQRILNSTRKKQVSKSEIKIRSKTLPAAPKTNNNKTNAQQSVQKAAFNKLQKQYQSSSNQKTNNIPPKIASFRNRKVEQRRYRTIQSIKEQSQMVSQQFYNKNNKQKTNIQDEEVREILINQDKISDNNRDGF